MTGSRNRGRIRVDVAVVGAGIVGVSCAHALASRGLSVALIDRTGIGEETSAGNAGAFAFSDILPLASPGILWKAPKWLVDPSGPLSLPPSHLPAIAPWLWRFFRAGRLPRYRRSIEAQAALMQLSQRETSALIAALDLKGMVHDHGALHLHDTARSFEAAKPGWDVRERHGIAFRHLDRAGIDAIQPGLARHFSHATFVPEWSNVGDPQVYTKTVGSAATDRGASFLRDAITAVTTNEDGVTLRGDAIGSLEAGQAVIAAGAWSHHLAAQVGDRIPLETERGYNTTLASDAFDLRCQLVFDDHGFVVSPLDCGVRVGGAVELAGLKRPPDYRRCEVMLAKAARFMPGLKTDGGTQWMGFRPSLPDTLPVIGRSPGAPRVIYAFGHGHLGLTQAAATARLVADLAGGQPAALPLAPYAPDRF
ncbi:NAD(P)/FAD-dependent oxidoreductase [Pararhizobium haloflavum]|uniref:NAD(P)/FAD-dependent oxidoreductase n=1 Tax=Pararhizobium haloflavum TaxID=2037914 RepID=UPI000C1926E6|nr:FAD-binding oxidoreductase [Pararhizobium haloflavum]